jgi:hypothetical protein
MVRSEHTNARKRRECEGAKYAERLLLSWVLGLALTPSWAINTAGVESGPNPSCHFSGTE